MLSNNGRAGFRKGLALAALGAVAMSACDADREDFISPIGDAILDFSIGLAPGAFPSGSGMITSTAFAGFDPAKTEDAFDRGTGALGLYGDLFGDCFGFDITGTVRNSSEDPRLPALAASGAAVDGFMTLLGPQCIGEGFWDLFGGVTGLAPNTTYTVALARMSLTVNGELDAEQVLLGEAVTEPDMLAFLGGAEGGDETAPCDFSAAAEVDVDASTNPLVLGTVVTDASGDVTVDCVPVPVDDSPWWRSADEMPAAAEDSVPLGINASDPNGGSVLPGQFNYVLLVEGQGVAGNPMPDVNPTVRLQIGPDIDASGNVVPNGMAPFPTAAATDEELMSSSGAIAQASGISFEATNLLPVTGVYQIWFGNDETQDILSAPGEISVNGEVVTTSGTTFNVADPSDVVTFVTDDATAGAALGPFTHVFLSIESSGAAEPSAAQPVFGRFTDMAEEPENPFVWTLFTDFDASFGTFDSGDTLVVFAPSGFGQGAFTGEDFGTADLFRARFRNVTRPPVGYFYEGFLIDEAIRFPADIVFGTVSTGDLTTEFAEGFTSLRDVDVDPSISAQIGPSVIIESANRATLEEVGHPFQCFETYILRLRPKAAVSSTAGYSLLMGTIPETLAARDTGPIGEPPGPVTPGPCEGLG